MEIPFQAWQAAQQEELANWQHTIGTTRDILAEMADSAALDGFMASVSELRKVFEQGSIEALEVGVGPLGLGWVGLFGNAASVRAWAIDPLPLLPVELVPDKDLASFISQKRRNYRFFQAAAEEAQFPPERMQLIVCDNVLDHAQKPLVILKNCWRWLSVHGFLVVGVNTLSLAGLIKWRLLQRVRPTNRNFVMHPHCGTHRAWRSALVRAGFCITREQGPAIVRRILGHAMRSYFACQKKL